MSKPPEAALPQALLVAVDFSQSARRALDLALQWCPKGGSRGRVLVEKRLRFSIWYFLAAFALVILLHTYLIQEQVGQISYAQFKRLVCARPVTYVVLGPAGGSGRRAP